MIWPWIVVVVVFSSPMAATVVRQLPVEFYGWLAGLAACYAFQWYGNFIEGFSSPVVETSASAYILWWATRHLNDVSFALIAIQP